MYKFVTAKREHDAVIAISQDNKNKIIEIIELNKAAADLLCYEKNKLLHKPLTSILCSNSIDYIESGLEYNNNGNDLSDILSKISNLSLIKGNGEEVKVKIKVFRTGDSTTSKVNYELLIYDLSLSHKLHIFRNQYLSGRKYSMHADLEIIDEPSTMLELEVILNFIKEYNVNAVAGLIGHQTLDSEISIQSILKVIVDSLQKNYRGEDIIGYSGNDKVIFVLMGCSPINSSKAISRIYSKVSQVSGLAKISIGYINILDDNNNVELLAKLKLALGVAQMNYKDQSYIQYTQTTMGNP